VIAPGAGRAYDMSAGGLRPAVLISNLTCPGPWPGLFLRPETPAGSAGAASAALCRSGTLPGLPGLPRIESAPTSQQKVFQDVFLFAASERSVAKAASYFVIDGLGPRFGFDHLVDSAAAWTLEERKRARINHDCPRQELTP
jgi:hypothetical protein